MLAGNYKEIRSNIDLQKKYYNSIHNCYKMIFSPMFHPLISFFTGHGTLSTIVLHSTCLIIVDMYSAQPSRDQVEKEL